jgi:hypothetical protein
MKILEQIDLKKSKENQKRSGEVPSGEKTAETIPTDILKKEIDKLKPAETIEPLKDKWEEVSGPYLEKLKVAGRKLKQVGSKWFHDISDKKSVDNTLNPTLPSWTNQYPCLSDVGTLNKTVNDNKIVHYGDNYYFYFFEDKKFFYDEKDNQIGGTWECVSGKLIIKTEDGLQWSLKDQWVKQPSDSTNTSTSDNTTIYKTHGDPYQYKVVDGKWFTKSLENRGIIIPDWISLETNIKATNILDGRFPNARK